MIECKPDSSAIRLFSIIIAAYNDWASLEECLRSLGDQTGSLHFEVIIVDDGSHEPAPESICQWGKRYPLSVVRQAHAGIPTARNLGVQNSKGDVLVFTDTDCRFETNCLSVLNSVLAEFPQHNCFQLHLAGDSSSLFGRAEDLRLLALQNHLLQPDGRIPYLNTAGFAIRREHLNSLDSLFDPVALRAEDTLLLVNLMEQGEIPFFVPKAMVQHTVNLSLTKCFRKDVRLAWLEAKTFELIAAKGVRVRIGNRERLQILRDTWRTSRQSSVGRAAWFVLAGRQMLQRMISALYTFLRMGFRKHPTSKASSA